MTLKSLVIILITLNMNPVFSQEIGTKTIIEALPAVVKALNKGESNPEKSEINKELRHPKVINKYKINACSNFVCAQLGTFGCDTGEEILQIKKSCESNSGVACMQFICEKLGVFGCDSVVKLDSVIKSCSDVQDSICLDYTCDKLGSFACDSVFELSEVATSCKGADMGCIKLACDEQSSFACDSLYEIKSAAATCNNAKSSK